ncbi:PAS domain-containing protein [Oleiharenicola lentus]|uniref:PAS domain-containing protein n=1 Tax=Oleiharenicola lentus TaxID=2508720 RepID=UPI003F667C49
MKPASSRPLLLCVAYVVLHFALHLSANWFEVSPGISVSVWYPPCGLAFALLVLLGPRYLWLVYLVNFSGAWFTATPRETWTGFFYPGLLTLSYGTGAWLVRRYLGPRLLPDGKRATLIFCLAITLPPLFSALVGTSVINLTTLNHTLNADTFARSVVDWWIGDASGLLVVVPVVMVFVEPWLQGRTPLVRAPKSTGSALVFDVFRWAVLFGTLLAVIAIPVLREHSAFYLCFLPLVWICVRHGLPGATLATLLVMFIGLIAMRVAGTTRDFSYIFLLFEVAVAGVGLGLGTLVTRRNEAERQLAASQAQLDRVITGAKLGLWDWNVPANHVDANARLYTMLGYDPATETEPFFKRWHALIHPDDHAGVDMALNEHLSAHSELYEAEFRMRAKNGEWRWIQARGSVVMRDAAGKPLRVSGTHVDITDRKRAEAEVTRLLRIIEATPDFILTTDADGKVLYANAALLTMWGQTASGVPWPGRSVRNVFEGDAGRRLCNEAIPTALATGTWRGEIEITDRLGRKVPVSLVAIVHRSDGDAGSVSFIMRDISEQKRAEGLKIEQERQLLQMQKHESLVVLAGGMAHDFNNLMTAVVGNANLARYEVPADAETAQALLASIENAATRAAALCQQMLAYAGRAPVAFTELNLNTLVAETIALLDSTLNKKVTVIFERGEPLALMLAASQQLQQVVTNLLLNAADAIGDKEGRIIVSTRSARMEAKELGELFPGAKLPPGDYVVLAVKDNGAGMKPEVRARIFEPFFTTKFAGQGLGLAAVGGVVRSHHGAINVISTPGQGALFRVAFPALAARPPAAEIAVAPDANWRGSGLVLVVDDDRLIVEVTGKMLTTLGFEVVQAKDGVEAVEIFRSRATELRCVVMDITMPHMDGLEAHAAMNKWNSAVPVILMSGFSQKLANLPPHAIHPQGVLAKPFSVKHLRERVAEVLGGSR